MSRQLEFDGGFAREVVEVPVAEEMSESFLAYSLSVITSRAIPDVRDGLKPVQRRILWSMLQMGIRPGTPYRKSARIVGDTMGRYHPHGDAAIYDTLTRMGQDFSRMVPFIDPQGNFGSLDDPPAAAALPSAGWPSRRWTWSANSTRTRSISHHLRRRG